jgi:hypothetical protein
MIRSSVFAAALLGALAVSPAAALPLGTVGAAPEAARAALAPAIEQVQWLPHQGLRGFNPVGPGVGRPHVGGGPRFVGRPHVRGSPRFVGRPGFARVGPRRHGFGWGPAAAVGVGVAAGALLAAPAFAAPGYYAPAPVYVARPQPRVVYVDPGDDCWIERRRVWSPRQGRHVVRNVEVCH